MGQLECIDALLKAGADVALKDTVRDSLSPQQRGVVRCVTRRLISPPLPPLISLAHSTTASALVVRRRIQNAAESCSFPPRPFVHQAQCTDIYALDSDEQGWRFSGSLALHWAAYFGHGEAVKMLLDHGSPVDTVDDGRSTALQAAAHTGHAEAAEMIIAAGADVNAADEVRWESDLRQLLGRRISQLVCRLVNMRSPS